MTDHKKRGPAESSLLAYARQAGRFVQKEALALALGLIIIIRPLRDGETFQGDNMYMVWALMLLTALWGARMLFRAERVDHKGLLLVLSAFFLVALAGTKTTVMYDATYRGLLIWASYIALFFLVSNGLRSTVSWGIVAAALVVSGIVAAAWALIHLWYILPLVRQEANPELLRSFFGEAVANDPDLIHRLNSNRAFGSFLHSNALAAFLIAGIPYALAETVRSWRAFRDTLSRRDKPLRAELTARTPLAALVAGAAVVVLLCVSFFVSPLVIELATQRPWTASPAVGFFFVLLLPSLAGAGVFLLIRRYGLAGCGRVVRLVGAATMVVVQSLCLALTYSRGGMLSLFVALVLMAALLWVARKGAVRAAAVAAMVLLAVLATAPPGAHAQPGDGLRVEGAAPRAQELASAATLSLRLGYWKTGLKVFADNPVAGVGLGCFRYVYTNYQAIDAPSVQMAHNDYLQMLCETGLPGGLLFLAFWTAFVVWGARRVWEENDRDTQWILAGLLCATLAFLGHSFLDFNFQNPAVAVWPFITAGLFCARVSRESQAEDRSKGKALSRVSAAALLLAAAVVAGAGVPPFVLDHLSSGGKWLDVGDMRYLRVKYSVGTEILARWQDPNPDETVAERYRNVMLFVPDRGTAETFGEIAIPQDARGRAVRRPLPDEVISGDALVIIEDFDQAVAIWRAGIEAYLKRSEQIDQVYPHTMRMAEDLHHWYKHLQATAVTREQRETYTEGYLRWARNCVERCPRQAWYHQWYARALWARANLAGSREAEELFAKALDHYERSTELYPRSPEVFEDYGRALRAYAKALEAAERTEEARQYAARAQQALDAADARRRALEARGE